MFFSDLDTDQTTNGTFLNLFMRVFYLFCTKINQKQWECGTSEICRVIEIETIVGSLKLEISYFLSLFCWQKYVWSNAWRFKSSILILTLIGMRGGYFYLLVLFGSDFVSWIFNIKNFEQIQWNKIFCRIYGLAVIVAMSLSGHLLNIDEIPLGGAKDEHFLAFIAHANES